MYKIAICDDDLNFLKIILKKTEGICQSNHYPVTIDTYDNSSTLLYDLQDRISYDIYLLDIEMPHVNGMEIAKTIKKLQSESIVILITAFTDYAIDAFQYFVFRFIPKGLIDRHFAAALKAAMDSLVLRENSYYNLYNSKQLIRICYKHIYYIYKDTKNSIFMLSTGQEKERKSLSDIYKELNSTEFIFIERGYIVNIYHIANIKGHTLTLKNGTQLPISHSHLRSVQNAFLRI